MRQFGKPRSKRALVDQCRNLFGVLQGDVRQRLEAVLEFPCQETWEDAHSIVVSAKGMTTLWQAWIAVDDLAPRSKPLDAPWPRVPNQLCLYRALKHATRHTTKEPSHDHRLQSDS